MHRWIWVLLAAGLLLSGCGSSPEWVLPEAAGAAEWFGEDVEARIDGNVLEIRGEMDPEHLRRGGQIWARSGPYFYLFNVHVQRLLESYPDLAAVRAVTVDADGKEVARAMLHREELNPVRWKEALARTSLAQRDGTASPRTVERLIRFGEEHTEFEYAAEQ